MPAFQAINLEPEENIVEQIDTAKELHVDEALKLFQKALRLHAQGPAHCAEAAEAYEELFKSEIFKFREARTDYERAERHVDGKSDPVALGAFSAGLDVDAGGADGVAASLAQALYISYKNYGQFFLDRLQDSLKSYKDISKLPYTDDAHKILDNWVKALDQDPSDPELWRKASRFAAAIDSSRLKRFCLEAAIEMDDDPAVDEVEPPSLAEGWAGEQLKDHLQVLGDRMALSHPSIAPWMRRKMPQALKRHLDPINFLPDPTAQLTPPASSPAVEGSPTPTPHDSRSDMAEEEPIETWSELALFLLEYWDDTVAAVKVCQRIASTPDAKNVERSAEQDATGQENSQDGHGKSKPGAGGLESSKTTEQSHKERNTPIPIRKRSQSVAGLGEGTEEEMGASTRSKRMRRRTDIANAEEPTNPTIIMVTQLRPYQESDHNLFQVVRNVLESIGLEDRTTFEALKQMLDISSSESRPAKFTDAAALDLRAMFENFSDTTANVLLNKKEQPSLNLSSFLEHAKSGQKDANASVVLDEKKGLKQFQERISERQSWITVEDIAFEWILEISRSYSEQRWPESLKSAVIQVLNKADAVIYGHVSAQLEFALQSGNKRHLASLETMVPMMFELYIEIYEEITNPTSVVDDVTRLKTKYRLNRWLDIASHLVRSLRRPASDALCVRLLWASVMASALADDPVREHILAMWTSLREFLAGEKVQVLSLPNNAVMANISAAAADREISKLNTMDFFLNLFQEDMTDPIPVIDTLEPVLNPFSVYTASGQAASRTTESTTGPVRGVEAAEDDFDDERCEDINKPISECATQRMQDLWKFLENSSIDLRLFLWSRLGDAYEAISYTTKRFSCLLKSIEMIVDDIQGSGYASMQQDSRRMLLVKMMKSLDGLLVDALVMALNDSTAFDIVDDDHIRTSAASLARLGTILHSVSLFEDEVRVGLVTVKSGNSTFQALLNKVREMQVRTWCLLYTLIKQAMLTNKESLKPEDDLATFLAAVHLSIGHRKFCKVSNKVFLNMMRAELFSLQHVQHWEDHLGQVLYDMYGLKLGVGIWELQDHGCPYEKLEKRQTMQLVDKVMTLANRMSLKDLLKSDLKTTIDHMQSTIGQPKSTPQMIHNLRNLTEVLKKPIHPLRLYRALEGGIAMDAVTVNIPEASLANGGWFFLLGMIALTKFKGVELNRRQTPGATDDLRIGATFLRLQLQFTADKWDAWFRLGECFDYELDESVLWTADKINKDRAELVKFQRNAIHCYTLALSHSRNQERAAKDSDALHDLYYKFASRMYSSSREPFAMEPFQHSDQERFFIEVTGCGTYKKPVHEQMTRHQVWRFAAKLFKMAIERKPSNWKDHYMLAKCYWKLLRHPEQVSSGQAAKTRVTADMVLEALKEAAAAAYKPRKSKSSDPILEPHYKIVSVLHKMVDAQKIAVAKAVEILSEQPFGMPVDPNSNFTNGSEREREDWKEYIIHNLVKLRDKDKSNWQHRIVMRHARILHDASAAKDSPVALVSAKSAFNLLRENIFTKTMVMNVWKCDTERPGRHHVFTEQYTRFMVRLLEIMDNRLDMEQLLRRLRKKSADFYHFTDLWQSCSVAYVALLRKAHGIDAVSEDVFKSLSLDEFEIISQRITKWARGGGPHIPAFECMREAVELKKLNGNLMKAGPIDDLINDCYSKIYTNVASTLVGLDPIKMIEEENHAKEIADRLKVEAAKSREMAGNGDGDGDGEQQPTKLQDEKASDKHKPNGLFGSLLNPQDIDSGAGTATPMDTEKSEAAPRRKTGVRRPDILRKAEQAVAQALELPKPTAKSRKSSISSAKRNSQMPNVVHSDDADDNDSNDDGPDAQLRRDAAEASDQEMHDVGDESMRNHVHLLSFGHSGDDSDLSDAPEGYEEEVSEGLLNLGRQDDTSGDDADVEIEGDEDGPEPEVRFQDEDTAQDEDEMVIEEEIHAIGYGEEDGADADVEDGSQVGEDGEEGEEMEEEEEEEGGEEEEEQNEENDAEALEGEEEEDIEEDEAEEDNEEEESGEGDGAGEVQEIYSEEDDEDATEEEEEDGEEEGRGINEEGGEGEEEEEEEEVGEEGGEEEEEEGEEEEEEEGEEDERDEEEGDEEEGDEKEEDEERDEENKGDEDKGDEDEGDEEDERDEENEGDEEDNGDEENEGDEDEEEDEERNDENEDEEMEDDEEDDDDPDA